MGLRDRINSLENRVHVLETAARLRSASISEGITTFEDEGKMVIEDGGSLTIANGGKIGSGSWSIGVNENGTTYADLGDVLISRAGGQSASRSVQIDAPMLSDTGETIIPMPTGWTDAVLYGTVNVISKPEINCLVRITAGTSSTSLVLPAGSSATIPIMEQIIEDITLKIYTVNAMSVLPSILLIGESDAQ